MINLQFTSVSDSLLFSYCVDYEHSAAEYSSDTLKAKDFFSHLKDGVKQDEDTENKVAEEMVESESIYIVIFEEEATAEDGNHF